MIDDLDNSIEQLLQLGTVGLGKPLPFDLSFAIPDKNFTTVSKTRRTLNCYLYEINEDRDLRNMETVFTRKGDGTVTREFPPARIKFSYCITAWSPAQPGSGLDPEHDEHNLLGVVLRVLLQYPALPANALAGVLSGQTPLPSTTIALPDTSKATSDFWSAIGGQLRPSLDYKVTCALPYQDISSGPMVRAIRTDLTNEAPYYTIGGNVHDSSASPAPVMGAWVRVNETDMSYVTDALGNFIIERIAGGTYTLTARANGFKDASRLLNVPPQQSDGSTYDIVLTPQ
jgi:Pvc16 N-terminal domain/Carboxypeptidase regulatory-like domain